jgi:hypothetical protein
LKYRSPAAEAGSFLSLALVLLCASADDSAVTVKLAAAAPLKNPRRLSVA